MLYLNLFIVGVSSECLSDAERTQVLIKTTSLEENEFNSQQSETTDQAFMG
jgi:hypothetical protein